VPGTWPVKGVKFRQVIHSTVFTSKRSSEKLQKLFLPILYASVLAGPGLAFVLPPVLGLDYKPAVMALRVIVASISLALFALGLVRAGTGLCGSPVLIAVATLWFALLLRTTYDIWIRELDTVWEPWVFFYLGLGVSLIPALGFLSLAPNSVLRRAQGFVFVALLLSVSLFVFVSEAYMQSIGWAVRMQPMTFNAISVGHYSASLALLALLFLLERQRKVLWRTIFLVTFIFAVTILSMSASRGPIISFVVTMVIVMFFYMLRRRTRRLTAIVLSCLLLLILTGTIVLVERFTEFGPVERLEIIGTDINSELRIDQAQGGLSQFMASPIIGSAIVETNSRYHPHNSFVETLMAVGLFGGLLYGLVWISVGWKTARALRFGWAHAWVGVLAVQWGLGSMFSGSILGQGEFWALAVGLLSADFHCLAMSSGKHYPVDQPDTCVGLPGWSPTVVPNQPFVRGLKMHSAKVREED